MSVIVKLNVGGVRYETTKSTLMSDPESMLARIIQQPNEMQKINSGQELFVDRDGKHFEFILNYLRNGDKTVFGLKTDDPVWRLLLQEADFYQLRGLTRLVNRKSDLKVGDLVKLNLKDEVDIAYWHRIFGIGSCRRYCKICFHEYKALPYNINVSPTQIRLNLEERKHEYFVGKIIEIVDQCAMVKITRVSLAFVFLEMKNFTDDDILKFHIPLDMLKAK